jgi:hypothetical protein
MYQGSSHRIWALLIKFFSRSIYTHCTIEIDGNTLVALIGIDATFASSETVNSFLGEPDTWVELGELDVDVAGIDKNILQFKQGSISKVLLWYFVTRWFGSKKPKTCTSIVCEILSHCGYHIEKYVLPSEIYKEIKK